jgi:putative pyoverdin transport system ATP-binding/permease protein
VDPQVVLGLLRQMRIDDKTSFENGRFTRRDLSTGQRKRLAMTVALLEDRPICLFDEWAADQDPEFRKYFYDHIIPSLKRRGRTVIAVSHDDRYFHCADRVVTLEYGKVRSVALTKRVSGIDLADSAAALGEV